MKIKLPTGVTLSVDNPFVAQQYLKYGAVEITEPEKVKKPSTRSKSTRSKSTQKILQN